MSRRRATDRPGGRRLLVSGGGRRVLPRRWRLRSLALAAAGLCLLGAVCGQTYSYFSGKDKAVNRFELSQLNFVIEEPSWAEPDRPVRPGDVLPKDPQVVNTGETDFVVRLRIQEVWTPKNPADTQLSPLTDPDYVRYFAANRGGDGPDGSFSAQQLLNILAADGQLGEGARHFALRLNLTPNPTVADTTYWDTTSPNGWYRGTGTGGDPSPWLYYNQVLSPGERTEPVFQAVTIRTGEDVWPLDKVSVDGSLTGEDYSQALEQAQAALLAQYEDTLTRYDVELYVYAETVQADPFAWQDAWGADLPAGWADSWGGGTG